MKKIIFLLLLSGSLFSQPYDLIHTELHIQPEWKTNFLQGKAILTLKVNHSDYLVLDAKEMKIDEIEIEGKKVIFEYDSTQIRIRPQFSKDTISVVIDYKSSFIETNSSEVRHGFYFVNIEKEDGNRVQQFWTHGQTNDNSYWFPTIDSPAQKHTQDIYITLDSSMVSLSNGLLTETAYHKNGMKTDHWQQLKPHAPYLTMVAGGNFVKVVDPDFNRFEVSYYVEPDYAPHAVAIFANTAEMIDYFEGLLDFSFPWDKYAQMAVRNFVTAGMENTSATLFYKSILKDSLEAAEEPNDYIIAHELFHQWFGNLVTPSDWRQVVLSEAMATYGEYLWAAYKYGQEEADYKSLSGWRNYVNNSADYLQPLIPSNEDTNLFDLNVYQKGARIIHHLRKRIGDESFFKGLQIYLRENAFKTADIDIFREVFERTSQTNLKPFFDQWFFGFGIPELNIKMDGEDGRVSFEIDQEKNSYGEVFEVDLPFKLVKGDTVVDTVFSINNHIHNLSFAGQIDNYIPDSDGYFPGVIFDDRAAVDYLHQYKQAGYINGRSFGLAMADYLNSEEEEGWLESDIREAYLDAMKDDFWRIRQQAVNFFRDYDGEDFHKVEKALEDRIVNDPDDKVKADALRAVKKFLNPLHQSMAVEALKVDSYNLKTAALELLLENNDTLSDSLAIAYEDWPGNGFFEILADYYIRNGISGKFDWFRNRIEELEGIQLYQYMGLYTAYLVAVETDKIEEALPFIKQTAFNKSYEMIRISGLSSLHTLQYYSDAALEVFEEALEFPLNQSIKDYFTESYD